MNSRSGPLRPYSSTLNSNPSYIFPSATDSASQAPNELLPNPWNDSPQSGSRVRVYSMNERLYRYSETPGNPPSCDSNASISFPEPQFSTQPPSTTTSSHVRASNLQHRHSTADFRSQQNQVLTLGAPLHYESSSELSHQGTSEYEHHPEYRDETTSDPSSNFSSTDSDTLQRFQDHKLGDQDQEWYKFVSKDALDALGKKEVRRQSIIFEVIKGERDYVADLELVQQLFVDGLYAAQPRIIPEKDLNGFIKNVFGNFSEILALHRHLLDALFERQREQHPVLQTVADIILDKIIRTEFRSAYEAYIKHYPLAESYHRKELKRNVSYQQFIQSVTNDHRIRKRDLVTFLSRPVTRLPRLNLLLEEILESTEKEFEHPDLETLPLILEILKNCIKSTQPGIEVAESKVQFWLLCESLVYQKAETIVRQFIPTDMDLYDQSRTLVYSGPVARRIRSESGFHEWDDLTASLLDNYFLLTREEHQSHSSEIKRHLISRPLHLSFLRLGGFNDAPNTRREKPDGGFLDALRSHSVPIFPFTIYHASSRFTRRYTLFAASESQRQKWKTALSEAISLHHLRGDASKWFDPQNISNSFFRVPNPHTGNLQVQGYTGRITSAVSFTYGDCRFLAVGCRGGVFVSLAGHEDFKKVLPYSDPTYIAAVQKDGNNIYNRFIIHFESTVLSYSLELLAHLALGQTTTEVLHASKEQICGSELNITFCKYLQVGDRALLLCASKRRLSSTLTLQVMEAIGQAEMEQIARKKPNARPLSFRLSGEPGFIPRDAFDVVALTKNIGICTQEGIVIADPTNLVRSTIVTVPDFCDAPSNSPMSMLKERLKDAKPLGLMRVNANELLVIYDTIGCYITKRGVPSRSSGYTKWETQASGFAHRGNNILLLSPQFIEIRDINTGRIVQVIQGTDMRLMYDSGNAGNAKTDRILVAMQGDKNERDVGSAERLVELVETVEYVPQVQAPVTSDVWEDWDM